MFEKGNILVILAQSIRLIIFAFGIVAVTAYVENWQWRQQHLKGERKPYRLKAFFTFPTMMLALAGCVILVVVVPLNNWISNFHLESMLDRLVFVVFIAGCIFLGLWVRSLRRRQWPKFIQTKPFSNPARFLGKGWTIWKGPVDGNGLSGEEDIDKRSLDLTKVELGLSLVTPSAGTRPNEKDEEDKHKINYKITGIKGTFMIKYEEELLRYLKARKDIILLGGNVFMSLWLDYQYYKKDSFLELLYQTRQIARLDFFGLVLRAPDGGREVLCLERIHCENRWRWRTRWLETLSAAQVACLRPS